jgi:hypothetical protein
VGCPSVVAQYFYCATPSCEFQTFRMSSNRQFQCGEMWSSSQHASTTSSSSSPPVSQLSSHADSSTSTNTSNSKSLRAFTFNIERGYEWRSIAQQLKQADADIVLLQEVDMFCERTGWVNVADEIAKELKMHVVWGCEFVELASWWRNKRLAGGGSHGNAILSRHKIVDSGCVIHATKPFDWSATTAWNWSEPRLGSRVFLWADIVVPHLFNASPIRCYSIHFENMTGILSRVKQMSEVLDHRISQKVRTCSLSSFCFWLQLTKLFVRFSSMPRRSLQAISTHYAMASYVFCQWRMIY